LIKSRLLRLCTYVAERAFAGDPLQVNGKDRKPVKDSFLAARNSPPWGIPCPDGAQPAEFWHRAKEIAYKEIPQLLKKIEESAQISIHSDGGA